MTKRLYTCVILLGCCVGINPLMGGTIVGNATGLASPAVTINFTEFGIPLDTVLTNQYSSLGITFSSGIYQDIGAVRNFSGGKDSVVTTPFTIYFTSPRTSAAVRFVSNAGTSTFTALLGADSVDSFSTETGAPLYYGFTGETFDQIRIAPGGFLNAAFVIEVQLGSAPVPEPSACALLGSGLLGLLAWRGRRKT